MKIITIATFAFLTTIANANQSNIDVAANVEAGCKFTLSDDIVNFNSEDYPTKNDALGGKYKDINLKINCSKGVRYSFSSKDLDKTTSSYYYLMKNNLDNNSKFNYSININGSLLHTGKAATSGGKEVQYDLRVSIASSPYNPSGGDYLGGFELVFTY